MTIAIQPCQAVDWHELPEETCLEVFKFLSVYDLGRAGQVCHRWSRITQDHTLWSSYERQVRGIGHYQDPTSYLHLQTEELKQCRILLNHLFYLDDKGVHIQSLLNEREKTVAVPFKPLSLFWVDHAHGGVTGEDQLAVVEMKSGAILATHAKDLTLGITSHFLVKNEGDHFVIESHDGSVRTRYPYEGEYKSSDYCGDYFAVTTESDGEDMLRLFNWKTGEEIYRTRQLRISDFEVVQDGNLLIEVDHRYCGVFVRKANRAILNCGSFTFSSESAPRTASDFYLFHSGENQITIGSLKDGKIMAHFNLESPICSASLCKERLIIYTFDLQLLIYDVKSKELLFAKEVELDETMGDCVYLTNISHDILALKGGYKILLIDIKEGKLLREIETPHRESDLFFDGPHLRECVMSEKELTIIERKFFDGKGLVV